MRTVFLLLCLAFVCDAFFFDFFSKKWNGLKVTFGLNPLSSYNFDSLPRTESDAESEGFVKISEQCETAFRGYRYVKDGDYSVVLVYDKNGIIAGIQAGVPDNQANGYPFPENQPPFIKDGNRYFITAYFVPPATICSTGRNRNQLEQDGTGTGLYIQNGTNPVTDNIAIPKQQADLATTKWTEGRCFPSMGKHYWYDVNLNSDCRKFFPVFLMYNRGELNSFGWAFTTDMQSPRLEHPAPAVFTTFIKEVPQCLYNMGTLTTLHIYLTSSPRLNFC